MGSIKKNINVILLGVGIAGVVCIVAILANPSYASLNNEANRSFARPWLSQYERRTVRVTFVTVPSYLGTDLEKTSALRIVEVGQAGIVVTFRPSRTVFFPYSQIASIEPIYRNN